MAIAEQKKSTPVLLSVAGVLVAFLLVFAVRALSRTTLQIRVGHVSRQTIQSTVSTNGKVEPVAGFQAHAPGPGIVEKILVHVGDRVTRGQLLIQMDDSDARSRVATAQANLTSAESARADIQQGGSAQERSSFTANANTAKLAQQQAQLNLATEQKLAAQGAASAGEVAAARQQLDAANLKLITSAQESKSRFGTSDRATAESRVADARAALAAARSSYAGVAIHSPIVGTVYSIPVSAYDYVAAGDDLLDVANLEKMQIRAYFDEPAIGNLADGQSVTITWEAKPGRVWHGHVQRVPATVIKYGSRNVGESLISVDDAHGDLLPNTNVTVQVTEMQRPNVLSIPREALHTEGVRDFVFRVIDGKLVQTPVEVGVVTVNAAEILGGVKDDDAIALGASISGKDLSNGISVKAAQ